MTIRVVKLALMATTAACGAIQAPASAAAAVEKTLTFVKEIRSKVDDDAPMRARGRLNTTPRTSDELTIGNGPTVLLPEEKDGQPMEQSRKVTLAIENNGAVTVSASPLKGA